MVYILWVSYTLKTRVIDWHVLLCFQKIVFLKMKTPSWFKTHYISTVSLVKQCFGPSFLVRNNKKTKNSQNCIVNHNPDQVLCYRNCNQLAFLHRKHAHSNIWADNYFDCKTCIFDISKLQLSCKMFNLNNVANGLVATSFNGLRKHRVFVNKMWIKTCTMHEWLALKFLLAHASFNRLGKKLFLLLLIFNLSFIWLIDLELIRKLFESVLDAKLFCFGKDRSGEVFNACFDWFSPEL